MQYSIVRQSQRNLPIVLYGGTACKFCRLHRGCRRQSWFVEPTKLTRHTSVHQAVQQPRFSSALRSFVNTTTTESAPSALEATKRRMLRSFTDNINSFNVSNVSNANVSNVSNVLNVSNHYTAAEDRSEILTWLSPLEPRIRHQDLRTRRADNIGEWFLQTDEFQGWCDGAQQEGAEHTTLFCCGGPAVGKTYLR